MLKLHDFCNRARYSIGVGVTGFELDFWGRVRNLSDAARSQYLATVQADWAFRLALIRDVASPYFASREADERIALAEATVRRRQDGLSLAERRLEDHRKDCAAGTSVSVRDARWGRRIRRKNKQPRHNN